ncbi:hypothetical protein VARIO8X_110086 [Burkholderiales bacterium 8X]|nr:hypothetical protein VARIO8X_110086 [Burkholderiales bacterium 8X]
MEAGATFAKKFNLRPGIALSPELMAQLTSDVVWLVERTVTLADGSTQTVLVPQVYVRVRSSDIDGSGSLLAADRVILKNAPDDTGDLVNRGTIAGRTLVAIDANNVRNLGGRISGGSVEIKAQTDIENLGGTIDAKKSLSLQAGRDVRVETTTNTQSSGLLSKKTNIDRVAGLYVTNPGGTLVVSAGQDVNLIGAIVSNGAGPERGQAGSGSGSGVGAGAGGATSGLTAITAGRDIHLGTVTESEARLLLGNAGNYRGEASSREIGTTVTTNGTTAFVAGQDFIARQATVDAGSGLLINSAIQGGSFEQNLKEGLKTALIDTAAASAAGKIGALTDAETLNVFTNKVAHAIAGCAAGAVQANKSSGCGAGALGAVIGEISGSLYGRDEFGDVKPGAIELARTLAGVAAGLAGLDAKDIGYAAAAGANAAANNALSLRGSAKLMQALRACASGSAATCDLVQLRAEMEEDSKKQAERIESACTGSSNLDKCTGVVVRANLSLSNLITGYLYSDTDEKKNLVSDLVSRQVNDMTRIYEAIEIQESSASARELLAGAIVGILQMPGIPAIKGSPGKGQGAIQQCDLRICGGATETTSITAAPRQIEATWGAGTYRNGGFMTSIEHIIYRHGPNSGFPNVSRFAEGTKLGDVSRYVDAALRSGTVTQEGRGAYTVEHDFGKAIGFNADGADASRIRVHVRDGVIKTAFPF